MCVHAIDPYDVDKYQQGVKEGKANDSEHVPARGCLFLIMMDSTLHSGSWLLTLLVHPILSFYRKTVGNSRF